MLRKVFETCWPITVGPNVAIFTRFQHHWAEIDQSDYDIGLNDEYISESIGDANDDIAEFIEEQFQVKLVFLSIQNI